MKVRYLFAMVMLLLSLGAFAQSPPDNSLRFSGQQEEALKSIRASYETRRSDVILKIKGKKLEIAELLKRDDVEKSVIKARLDEELQLEGQLQSLFLDELFDAKSKMTPAQWGPYRRRVLMHLYNRGH